jgi:HPt (histidine-containing phosphotransfer) domain-containing protein
VNEPKLNPAAIERLRKLGGDKFTAEMIDLFFTYGGKKLAETRAAQQAGNVPGIADAAHPLKSSAGNVGATRVQELATQIEQLARAAKGGEAAPLIGELEREFAEAKTLLETEKLKLSSKPA